MKKLLLVGLLAIAAYALPVLEVGDELFEYINKSNKVAVLFDIERDCIECDRMSKFYHNVAEQTPESSNVIFLKVDLGLHPETKQKITYKAWLRYLEKLPRLMAFTDGPEMPFIYVGNDNGRELEFTQKEVANFINSTLVAAILQRPAIFHGTRRAGEPPHPLPPGYLPPHFPKTAIIIIMSSVSVVILIVILVLFKYQEKANRIEQELRNKAAKNNAKEKNTGKNKKQNKSHSD